MTSLLTRSCPTYVFTNRVYPPVPGATGELLKELAEGLAAGGARVVVITSRGPQDLSLPNRETVNGVELIRVGSAPFTRASHARRAMSYAGLYPQFAWQVARLGEVDAVVTMTDPPLQVVAGSLGARKARKKIHWAQDIYPELAEELRVLKPGSMAAQALRKVSTDALRRQDEVVVVGRCMRQRLINRGVEARSIEVIPNWSPVREASPESVAAMRRRLGWGGDFIALYSGNLGLAHDFDTLVEAASALQGSGVRMVFAGEGPRLDEVRRALEGFSHVSLIPSQPREDLAAFLGAADVHLVTVHPQLSGLVVPSKFYGIMTAGRPTVYIGPEESEVAIALRESAAGVALRNGDGAGVASVLRDLKADRARLAEMGDKARRVAQDYTFAKALERWQEILI